MGLRKPDVNGDDAGLDAETEKEEKKYHALLQRGHLRCEQMEAREIQASACGSKNQERDQEQTGASVRHDEEKQTGVARLFFFVLKADQAERRKRHDFPRGQEEERVG